MLDPASIERLAELPEQNDPMLNVALAEEGGAKVLLALVDCMGLGAEALDVIAERVAREGDSLTIDDEEAAVSAAFELEQKLIGHPNAPRAVRDRVLQRHLHEPFFVLSAASHLDATARALELAASWPSTSPLHDRPWISLLGAAARTPGLLATFADGSELLREAAAALSSDAELLERLASDPARRVRRAVASNPRAGSFRAQMAASDPAVEVRARAARALAEDTPDRTDRFSRLLHTMENGGVLGADVRHALLGAGSSLDEEGAFLAARHLDNDELRTLVSQATGLDQDLVSPRGAGVGVGLGLRCRSALASASDELPLSNEIVHLVTRHPHGETRLTGKARVASWIAECLDRSHVVDDEALARELVPGALASERMVLSRWAARARASPAFVSSLELPAIPAAVVEICWRDRSISDEAAIGLASKIAPSPRSERELPEDELDLTPLGRPLGVLERAVLAAAPRTPVSPRGALAAIALDPRRRRYVLSAMPTWKGALTGARLARVLKSYAGALSAAARPLAGAAPAEAGAHPATVARWTDRKLNETEVAIAVAIGDLTADALVRRLVTGSIQLSEGVSLAAGVEARAAIDGPAALAAVVDYAASRRTKDAAALALWILLEGLDRMRAPSLIASAIDGLSIAGSVVAPSVCEALATLERRSPGRLEHVHAQSPRGRATVASGIARAYRAFGGMRDEG